MELREYQRELALQMVERLKQFGIVYLAAQVRVGKTLTALTAANMIGAYRVLFVTKKKAISSIESDFNSFHFDYYLKVINYEQVQKEPKIYDLIIVDEAHSLGAFPKPSLRTELLKGIVGRNNLILLSGTPSPESYSQLYHQFWISERSPFSEFRNFYKWAKVFVNVKNQMINGFMIRKYNHAKINLIAPIVKKYMITYTQKEAGFNSEVEEKIIKIKADEKIKRLVEILLRDKYYRLKTGGEIIGDTPAKLQTKIHQIYSGTILTETGEGVILNFDKAKYIKENYQGRKIAIFYKFIAEKEALIQVLSNYTESPEEFQNSNKIFISQIKSGAMGINLSKADVIIFYNIDFSSVLYWQARARSQSKEKNKSEINWLFIDGGIEEKIYQAVINKKDYTTLYFNADYQCWKVESKKIA